jgi:hypothetical protein
MWDKIKPALNSPKGWSFAPAITTHSALSRACLGVPHVCREKNLKSIAERFAYGRFPMRSVTVSARLAGCGQAFEDQLGRRQVLEREADGFEQGDGLIVGPAL